MKMKQFSRSLFFLSFMIYIFERQGARCQTVDSRSIRTCVYKAARMVGRSKNGTIGQDSVTVNDPISMLTLYKKNQQDPRVIASLSRSAEIVETATRNLIQMTGSGMDTLTPESTTSSRFSQIVAPFCAAKNVNCDPYEKYRSYDGKCNNLGNPLWGSALTAQPRFISATYGDRYNSGSEPRKNSVRYGSLPNPRDISNTVHKEGTTFARGCLSNVAFTHFGQFIDHDVVSTPIKKSKKGEAKLQCCNGNTPVNRPECLSFSTPVGEFQTTCMHFVRSETAPRSDCSPGYSDQMNQVTSYLDLSSTYGSSKKMADELVDWKTGKLFEGAGGLLPDGEGDCIKGALCFKSGDIRHTEVPMLNAIHTLFLREHNRIVGILKKINPHHDGLRLYNEARKILIGVYQHIIYKEFIPKLLGTTLARDQDLLPTSYGHKTHYNQNENAGTRNGFAGAAFRIGHTFVGKFVGTLDAYYNINEEVPLEGEFFNPRTIRSTKTFSVEKISNWMVEKFSGQSDPFVASAVRNHLFETKPGNGFDLSALNIQRGRDHGLPSYNKFRKFCGLQPALTFGYNAIGLRDMSYESAGALQRMYSTYRQRCSYLPQLGERELSAWRDNTYNRYSRYNRYG